jgi:hypothetical protein
VTRLRRGFKTEANAHATALRRELRLDVHAPLCPWRLAVFLDVPIVPLTALEPYEPAGVRYLTGKGRDFFSAVTIFIGRHGRKRVVFHNDGHAKTRQAANLAHELAHAILCHPPTPPFTPDPIAEAEAHWLGPTLLVPEAAALHIVEQSMSNDSAARLYGVSESLLDMRLNVTGARTRIARRRGR